MSYGNRSLDIATSRYSIVLSSADADNWEPSPDFTSALYTWNACNTFSVDPKYRAASVMVRSFYAYNSTADPDWLVPEPGGSTPSGTQLSVPGFVLRLKSASMPRTRVANARTKGTGDVLAVVPATITARNMLAPDSSPPPSFYSVPFCVGKAYDGQAATCGSYCASTLINDEIVFDVAAINSSEESHKYILPAKLAFILTLDVQLLSN